MSDVINLFDRTHRRPASPPAAASAGGPERAFRERNDVKRDIDAHIAARETYQRAVAWLAAAEAEGLPVANIEAAREDLVRLHAELVEAARRLVIVTPTDLRALCDLLMYLEHNYSVLPAEIQCTENRSQSLAFHLLRTMRLSLRAVAKYGKHGSEA